MILVSTFFFTKKIDFPEITFPLSITSCEKNSVWQTTHRYGIQFFSLCLLSIKAQVFKSYRAFIQKSYGKTVFLAPTPAKIELNL